MMEMKMWMKMKAMEDSLESDTKTSNKMRVLLAVAALFVAGALAGGKEMMEMKMWMKMKAMEGCFGEDVMKTHMIKMKKAAATCMRKDAPELDLPLFNNEFRLANVLTRRPRIGQGAGMRKMMKAFMQMQMISQLMDADSTSNYAKRAADDEFDLGSKLQEKLSMKKEEMEAKFDNITCMLRECDILDSENKFNPDGIKKEGDKYFKMLKSEWLRTELTKYCDQCVELAEAVPQSMLDECPWGGEMVKVKFYMKCMMKHKVKVCMNYDIKQKPEQHFDSVEKLEEETNIPEEQLFMLVREMLKGPEVEMLMSIM